MVLIDPVIMLVDPVMDIEAPNFITLDPALIIKTQLYKHTPDFLSFLRQMEPTSRIMETNVLTNVLLTAVVELLKSA